MKIRIFLFRILLVIAMFSASLVLSSCSKDSKKEKPKETEPSVFFDVDDMIINPAGTNAQRVMLVSVSLPCKTKEEADKLKERSPLIKDLIVTSLSGKSIEKLTQAGYKDSLKIELRSKLTSSLRGFEFKNIYFTKFIIQ